MPQNVIGASLHLKADKDDNDPPSKSSDSNGDTGEIIGNALMIEAPALHPPM